MDRRRVTLRIRGVVQGVGYRASAREEALRLGVHGWVRNREDGSVEAVVEGPAPAVDAFARWCQKGPRGADVSGVERVEAQVTGEFATFTVERTL